MPMLDLLVFQGRLTRIEFPWEFLVPSVSEVATAAEALDRVEMDLKVRQKLGERVWFGASLIVSDHGLGDETGTDTDFVVLTR